MTDRLGQFATHIDVRDDGYHRWLVDVETMAEISLEQYRAVVKRWNDPLTDDDKRAIAASYGYDLGRDEEATAIRNWLLHPDTKAPWDDLPDSDAGITMGWVAGQIEDGVHRG